MYENVRTWKDLCNINVEYLEGRHPDTFYHAGPLDAETIVCPGFLADLIELNKMGIFTHNSQPGINDEFEKQKSYLDFCCEPELAYQLLPRLLDESNMGDIHISFHCSDVVKPIYIDTFGCEQYNLTKYVKDGEWYYYTFWNKFSRINNNIIYEPNICEMTAYAGANKYLLYDLLVKSVDITIACKDYDEDFSAPDKLLDIINVFSEDLNAVD